MIFFFQEKLFQICSTPEKKKVQQDTIKPQNLVKYKDYMLIQIDCIPDG